ncbi:hypothetical protein [Enterococcus sp. AZ103]|uniref:hypothetical protein n=1 Tax=Enterococcus sp. AZ103 TaxID=2774628 RepID=UPI003F2065D8
MLKQKEITIPDFEDVTQVSLRKVTEIFEIEDHNLIELYSTEIQYMEQYLRAIFYYPDSWEKEIMEIGSLQLFKDSDFIDISEFLSEKDKPYNLLSKVRESTPQILIVNTEKLLEKNNLELLSDIACSATESRVIIFMTIGTKAEILPFVNFAQVRSQSLSDIVHYRKIHDCDVSLIEQFCRRFIYNFLI